MVKRFLVSKQKGSGVMSSSQIVDDAEKWAKALTLSEYRGPGDYLEAMRRAARSAGVSASLFWSLHYKKPKDVWASAYFKIKAAYDRERVRQTRKLFNEARKQLESGADAALVGQAMALAGFTLEDIDDDGSTIGTSASASTDESPDDRRRPARTAGATNNIAQLSHAGDEQH